MKLISWRLLMGSLITLALALGPTAALACGPFFEQAILIHSAHPDFPFSQYAQGNIGIVRPNFARSYLAVAYRLLDNKPLTATEQEAALGLWNFRLLNGYNDDSGSLAAWNSARKALDSTQGCEIDAFRTIDTPDGAWQNYLNCPDDAFKTAIETLKARTAKYGPTSPILKEWVKAQDLVFCHCASPKYDYKTSKRDPEPAFPQAAAADADPLVKADRAYQIAAAHFYAQQFDEALKEFQAIANDASSPWSVWAPYLMARTLVRQSTIPDKINTTLLAQADAQIKSILANPALSATHDAARNLQNFVGIRLYPDKTLKEFSAALSGPKEGARLRENLMDYTILFDNILGVTSDDTGSLTYSKIPGAIKNDDLSDWIATLQSSDPAASEHALARYQATKSVPWLIAAITRVDSKQTNADSLIDAALAVPPTSPAYLTAYYRAAQLLGAKNKPAAAKTALDKALSKANIPPSSRNLLLDERTKYADSLREFVSLVLETPALFSSDYEGNELPDDASQMPKIKNFYTGEKVLSPIGAEFFNVNSSESQLVDALQMKLLPPKVQKNFVQAAWTRAYLLNDKVAVDKMTPLLKQAFPAMAPILSTFDKDDAAARRFSGTFLLLHNPGMRPAVNWGLERSTEMNKIDDYQDNWWSNDPKEWPSLRTSFQTEKAHFPSVLLSGGSNELNKIKALGPAPNVMARETIAWSKLHGSDVRVPEALALVVKATRFGPKDGQTSKLSKEAFQILHHSYPNSPWAKRTPYYY